MNYQFNATLFDSPYRRDRAIAESWLYADGLNDEQEVQRILATVSPEQLASEVWEAWGFENTDDEDAPTLESLTEAFRSFATKAPDMRVEFSSNSLGEWLNVYREDSERPVLCGKIVGIDEDTWQVWINEEEPIEYPILMNTGPHEAVADLLKREIAARPEYSRLF
jgi:hypothetical protein